MKLQWAIVNPQGIILAVFLYKSDADRAIEECWRWMDGCSVQAIKEAITI